MGDDAWVPQQEPRRGPGRPRRDEVESRRSEILDAAVALFASRGLAGTTIEEVARAAGATKRTIYQHFGDKTGLFLAAVERLHERERAPSLSADLEDVAARIVHTLHGDDAVTLHRLVVAESLRLPELAAEFYARGPACSVAAIAEVLAAQGQDDGLAEPLYTLLLGEGHRRRLLGLTPAPTEAEARAHAQHALRTVLA